MPAFVTVGRQFQVGAGSKGQLGSGQGLVSHPCHAGRCFQKRGDIVQANSSHRGLGRGAGTHGSAHRRGRSQGRRSRPARTGAPALPGLWGHQQVRYGDTYPFWHFRGYDKHPDLYWYPTGYGAGASYLQGGYGGYYPGGAVLTDVFGDDYYFAYGYRCNGYRDGYYFGADGAPISYYGRPFYRRNADCENYFNRHGSWYGFSDCSRFEVEKGYCDDHDRR